MASNARPAAPVSEMGILISFLKAIAEKFSKSFASFGKTMALVNDRWSAQLVTLNIFKYVDLDSTHRNRKLYPLPSNYVVPYTNASAGSNALNAYDPVVNAFPYATGTTQAGSSVTQVVLAPNSSSLDNFYINSLLEISGQYVQVINYTGANQTATVNPALTSAPPAGTAYELRKGIPILTGTLQAGSNQNIVVLSADASALDDYYLGNFIIFDSGPASGQARIIMAYDGASKQAILSTALSVAPGLAAFEIDAFSYDNAETLRYSGSRNINQPACYCVQLLQLTIPKLTLKVGYGGMIDSYPYLYVHFYNEIKHSEITIYGNNPGARLATFKVTVDRSAVTSPPNFFVFDNINLTAPIAIKFTPCESIRFRVTLPSGEDLDFVVEDNPSPEPPNPLVQISALVGIRRIAPFATVESVA